MKLFIKAIILSFIIFIPSSILFAGTSPAELAIFPVYTGSAVGDSILKTVYERIIDACAASGRFIPAENSSMQEVFRSAEGDDRYGLYRNAATALKVDAYAVVSLYKDGNGFRVVVEFFAVAEHLKGREFKYSVYAVEPENIPLKAAREFARNLRGFPVYAVVHDAGSDGSFVVSAGQWHGIKPGVYSTGSGRLEVFEVARYTSRCRGFTPAKGQVFLINEYPDNKLFIGMMDNLILENTVRRFGTDPFLEKRYGSVQELMLATCLVNQGASFCVPGYGSYLSLNYLGIENAVADKGIISLTILLTAGHFLVPSSVTKFDINFFPWIEDNDKTAGMQRMQWFLWCTVPVTFTVSYYSQLANQYREKNLLPPVFMLYDRTAVLLSLFIPGGGLFYKGYSGTGWAMYSGEMSLAGAAVYLWGRDEGKYCLAGFALLKAADILAAWILEPSYETFRNEMAGVSKGPEFSALFMPDEQGNGRFLMSVSVHF